MYKFRLFLWIQILQVCVSCGRGHKVNKAEEVEKSASAAVVSTQELFQQAGKDSADEAMDSKAVSMLKEFYSMELSPGMRTEEELQREYACYFTKAMRDRIWRMTWDTGVNQVIRAQDVPQDSCETLRIDPWGHGWYRVRYTCGRGTPYEEVKEIPVKVVEEGDVCRIAYITPESLGQAHHDSLWYSGDTFPAIDRTAPLAFVKSFYDLYTLKHSTLSDDWLQELAAIRSECLTPHAQSRFKEREEQVRGDGYPEYDALIGRHDFEYPYRKEVWVHPTEGQREFQVGITGDTILVKVVEQEGKYYIDDIEGE